MANSDKNVFKSNPIDDNDGQVSGPANPRDRLLLRNGLSGATTSYSPGDLLDKSNMSGDMLHILIVYDRSDSRLTLERVLRMTDIPEFTIQHVPANLMAISCASEQRYDVCLIDSEQKEMLLTQARLLGFETPIVVLTEDSGVEILNALHHGASDCLIRSQLTPSSLEESICEVVERARNYEEKAAYERFYLGLVENSTDVIYTHDLRGNYTSFNRMGEILFEFSREELLGMNMKDVIAPGYQRMVWRTINKMLESRKPGSYEVEIVSKSKERILLATSNHLIYKDGTPVGVQGVAQKPPPANYRDEFIKRRAANAAQKS